MKIRTADLETLALDWVVGKIEGRDSRPGRWRGKLSSNGGIWQPSVDWQQGGPIIERERISSVFDGEEWWAGCDASLQCMSGMAFDGPQEFGPTLLIAAMRCYAALRLGDTVDVPDELGQA